MWARGRSRAAHVVANHTSDEDEALVVKVREALAENPWAQVGAPAIAWELTKLGMDPIPPLRTIERILARHDVPRRSRRLRHEPKGKAYPAPAGGEPNACQQADLIGPRYLEGGVCFYALNVVDVGRRKAASEVTASKSAIAVTEALGKAWERLGVPDRLQLDNQQALIGAGQRLGNVVRFCLTHGVTPVFVPFAEPWRNGIVEHFNDVWDKSFFRAERFDNVDQLTERLGRFETFHNANHRYSALKGATPDEAEARANRPPRFAQLPLWDNDPTGTIEYIRFIRSDRLLRILDFTFELPEYVTYEYVTATLQVETANLEVRHNDRHVARFNMPLKW